MQRSIQAVAVFVALMVAGTSAHAGQGNAGTKVKPASASTQAPKAQSSPKPQSSPKTQSSPKPQSSNKPAGGPKVSTTTKPTGGPKTSVAPKGQSQSTKGQSQTTKATGGGKAASTTGHAKGNQKSTASTTAGSKRTDTGKKPTDSASSDGAVSSTKTSEPVEGTTALTPVQQKLERNTKLADRLQTQLKGLDVMTAAEGFRNLGQFVAAVNVSSNHKLSFTELKTLMVDKGMSLGQALQQMRLTGDTATIAVKAETDATTLIQTTEADMGTKTSKAKPRSGSR